MLVCSQMQSEGCVVTHTRPVLHSVSSEQVTGLLLQIPQPMNSPGGRQKSPEAPQSLSLRQAPVTVGGVHRPGPSKHWLFTQVPPEQSAWVSQKMRVQAPG